MGQGIAWLKIGGTALASLALLATCWLAQDRFHQKHLADAARRCDQAAASPEGALDDCLPAVAESIRGDRRATICETALLPSLRPETRFAAQQACGAGTKRLIAELDVAQDGITALTGELADTRSNQAAATMRAEQRGRDSATRQEKARAITNGAPRGADGSIACDADCLRRLAD